MLHRFQLMASYLSKVTYLILLDLHLPPSSCWVTLIEFRPDFSYQKTRIPGLSCRVVCVNLSLAVLIEYQHVTDRQTDKYTDTRRQYIPC